MSIHVFVGPTLDAEAVRKELDASVGGPVAFGDVLRAAQERPRAIVIIDGYFERVPAVWHKEILSAMAEGIHVFGAGSMGALRAAELADFGMIGVGEVYEAYRAGALEDDDEVAIVHGPPEQGFAPLSEAMVNIRATLAAAVRERVLCAATAEKLSSIAKRRFYADRTYSSIVLEATKQGADEDELGAFRGWLAVGRIDQKRRDALALLRHIRDWLATDPGPKHVDYRVAPTDAWHEATRLVLARQIDEPAGSPALDDPIGEELKLVGAFEQARQGALIRGLMIDEARRAGVEPDVVALRAAADALRREHGLLKKGSLERWRAEQGLEGPGFGFFLRDQARLAWAAPLAEGRVRVHLNDHLRAIGEYGRLAERAAAKRRNLGELGMLSPSRRDANMDERELWRWYFVEKLGREIPDDMNAAARRLGFGGVDQMRAAALRELCWNRHGNR